MRIAVGCNGKLYAHIAKSQFVLFHEVKIMATVHFDLRSWFRESEHPVWYRRFSGKQQDRLLNEDLTAGKRIASILVSIVSFGLVSMVVSVLLAI